MTSYQKDASRDHPRISASKVCKPYLLDSSIDSAAGPKCSTAVLPSGQGRLYNFRGQSRSFPIHAHLICLKSRAHLGWSFCYGSPPLIPCTFYSLNPTRFLELSGPTGLPLFSAFSSEFYYKGSGASGT